MHQEHKKVPRAFWIRHMSAICVLVALNLVACSSSASPEITAQFFVRAMSSGNSDRAAHYVCPGNGVVFLVAIKSNWSKDSYEILDNDDQNARVRVKGRFQVLDKDLKQALRDLKTGLELTGTEWPTSLSDPAQLPVAMTVIVDLDFDQLLLKNNSGDWCIQQESIVGFYSYLSQLVLTQIAP